jgi:ubiquinone/menaquinone biosynthesis C-methylase UbiE
LKLNDPEVVKNEYANESRFERRRAAFAAASGPSALDTLFDAVAEAAPGRYLEVGCGPGDFAARVQHELDADVVALDISPRMVEITRARGVDARLGDVQALPFEDGSFDCAVAAWMLYHVPDLDLGLAELARVLRPGGRLVAATNSIDNLHELWDLVGRNRKSETVRFFAENAEEPLQRHFRSVQRRDVVGDLSFTRESARDYVANSIAHAHLADRIPDFDEPLVVTRHMTIFVAER